MGLLSRRFGGGEGGAALPPHQGVSNPSETAWPLAWFLSPFFPGNTPNQEKHDRSDAPRARKKHPCPAVLPSVSTRDTKPLKKNKKSVVCLYIVITVAPGFGHLPAIRAAPVPSSRVFPACKSFPSVPSPAPRSVTTLPFEYGRQWSAIRCQMPVHNFCCREIRAADKKHITAMAKAARTLGWSETLYLGCNDDVQGHPDHPTLVVPVLLHGG